MDRKEIDQLILAAYKRECPLWKNVRVLEVVAGLGGWIGVVSALSEADIPLEEMCFVYPDKTVRIFETTPELVHFFELRLQTPLLERLVAKPVISGAVFVFVLIGIFFLAIFKIQPDQALLASLTSVVGVAAGFFFGSAKA